MKQKIQGLRFSDKQMNRRKKKVALKRKEKNETTKKYIFFLFFFCLFPFLPSLHYYFFPFLHFRVCHSLSLPLHILPYIFPFTISFFPVFLRPALSVSLFFFLSCIFLFSPSIPPFSHPLIRFLVFPSELSLSLHFPVLTFSAFS